MATMRRSTPISDSSDSTSDSKKTAQSLLYTWSDLRPSVNSDRSDSNFPYPLTRACAHARNGVHAEKAVLRSLLSLTTTKTINSGAS